MKYNVCIATNYMDFLQCTYVRSTASHYAPDVCDGVFRDRIDDRTFASCMIIGQMQHLAPLRNKGNTAAPCDSGGLYHHTMTTSADPT